MLDAMLEKGSQDPFVHYARALEDKTGGDLAAARTRFEDVAKRFPEYVPTYLIAAQTCDGLGDEEAALQWIDRGLKASEMAGDEHAKSELLAFRDEID